MIWQYLIKLQIHIYQFNKSKYSLENILTSADRNFHLAEFGMQKSIKSAKMLLFEEMDK